MERLWAPWRREYLLGAAAEQGAQGCIFCRFPAQGEAAQAEHLILCCTAEAFVIMNRYPYNSGHLLVVPRPHTADLMALPGAVYQATCELLRQATAIVTAELGAAGANLGLNLGRVAGAGIDQHAHFHIVPRWSGDTNFMPVACDTKVLSEHLQATFDKLRPAFAALHRPLAAPTGDV
jgi:ATP adenylyltransferase